MGRLLRAAGSQLPPLLPLLLLLAGGERATAGARWAAPRQQRAARPRALWALLRAGGGGAGRACLCDKGPRARAAVTGAGGGACGAATAGVGARGKRRGGPGPRRLGGRGACRRVWAPVCASGRSRRGRPGCSPRAVSLRRSEVRPRLAWAGGAGGDLCRETAALGTVVRNPAAPTQPAAAFCSGAQAWPRTQAVRPGRGPRAPRPCPHHASSPLWRAGAVQL